ncbi:uncharacterized protein LOC124367022 [Homalodisca vitripennis]|uniref:uncharacterized protein LOC124367022 n=1 Tax=Homalodisca vitripennis TaxID=197043 RepID=UPI001EEBABD5|nr:uncharacterized protein LOC124367022 [Homalodisca vitripennis]KAG8337107.1 Serine/threonine-protein kinase N2 [Homalodisca vitripennis]
MAGKPSDVEQEWSVHAHLTISHGNTPAQSPRAVAHPCYGFQRGNIVFTTRPPGDSSSLPVRRPTQPYGRRCMSTCNITLDPAHMHAPPRCHHTVTLSCEPSKECDVCDGGRLSPTATRRPHTFTSHFCTRVPDKTVGTKTVASQTSQIFSPPTPPPPDKPTRLEVPGNEDKEKRPGNKSPRKLSRSPARLRGRSPLLTKREQSSEAKKKQPRTVHIDVYCTGSEASGSSDAEDPSDSSRQTVFESEEVRVVHTREDERLPQALCRQKRRTLSEASSSHSCLGGDTSISSLYPSQRSSFASGVSLGTDSLQTDSSILSHVTSSCALFSDEVITSWKDTSDVDSIRQSDLSLGRADSFDYENSIDRWRILQKEKAWAENHEKTWRSPEKERRHHMQQRRYQQYLERRGSPFPQWEVGNDEVEEETDSSSDISENSAGSEMGWTFGDLDEKLKHVKREDTVRRASRDIIFVKSESELKKQASKILDSGSLSDSAAPSPIQHRFLKRDNIGPFGVKEPSPPKAKLESTVTTPFTAIPGKKSDQMSKAEKFGTILGTLRKPGHHVGPSKNPDCSCNNCRQYYEEMGYRNRTRSLGDMPSSQERDKWKATLDTLLQNRLTEDSGSGEWDLGTPV